MRGSVSDTGGVLLRRIWGIILKLNPRSDAWRKLAGWDNHISPSHINSAIRSLPAWYLERVVGIKTDSSAAAERGKAAEHGICLHITGAVKDLDDAVRIAQKRFRKFLLDANSLNAFTREYEYLDEMIRSGVDALKHLGKPDLTIVKGEFVQPCVSARLTEVEPPCIGKLDALYRDKKKIVDIKTSAKAVRGLKSEWRRQGAFYAHACPDHEMWFCVITPKGAGNDPANTGRIRVGLGGTNQGRKTNPEFTYDLR